MKCGCCKLKTRPFESYRNWVNAKKNQILTGSKSCWILLVIALFCFILWLSCIADITSMRQLFFFHITAEWLNIWLTLSIVLIGLSSNALWENYSTTFMILTSFYFLLVIVHIIFFKHLSFAIHVECYIIFKVFLCVMLFFIMFMCTCVII